MQVMIIVAVIVYAISVYGAYELGRYERRDGSISVSIDDMTSDENFEEIKRIWRHDDDIDILS